MDVVVCWERTDGQDETKNRSPGGKWREGRGRGRWSRKHRRFVTKKTFPPQPSTSTREASSYALPPPVTLVSCFIFFPSLTWPFALVLSGLRGRGDGFSFPFPFLLPRGEGKAMLGSLFFFFLKKGEREKENKVPVLYRTSGCRIIRMQILFKFFYFLILPAPRLRGRIADWAHIALSCSFWSGEYYVGRTSE